MTVTAAMVLQLSDYHHLLIASANAKCDWELAYNTAYETVNEQLLADEKRGKLFLTHEERHIAAMRETMDLYRAWHLADAEAKALDLRLRCEATS